MPLVTRQASSNDAMDAATMLQNLERLNETVERSSSEAVALGSKGMTQDHYSRGDRIVNSFLTGIGNIGKCLSNVDMIHLSLLVILTLILSKVTKQGDQVYKELLKPVALTRRGQKKQVPAIVKLLAGEIDDTKLMIANRALVDWQVSLKLVKPKREGCPWYAPTTQATDYRTFFGRMNKEYGWQFNEAHFKNFEGCVDAVMAEAFQQREREWVSFLNVWLLFIIF